MEAVEYCKGAKPSLAEWDRESAEAAVNLAASDRKYHLRAGLRDSAMLALSDDSVTDC